MKVLFIVSRPIEINTSASIRNKAMIEGIIELGHSVDYLTTTPNKFHSNYDESLSPVVTKKYYIDLKGLNKIASLNQKFKFLNKFKKIVYNFMERKNVYDNLVGIVNHVDNLEVNVNDYDLVISSSDPKSSHLFIESYFNKHGKKTKWYQIWGDPFLNDITKKSNGKKDILIQKEEKKLLEKADKVFYVSHPTVKKQSELYPEFSFKFEHIYIPFERKIIYKNNIQNSILFLYTGDYNSNIRDIQPLIEAIKETNHRLIICGHSDLDSEPTKNIKFYPRQEYDKIKELEAESDVLIHLSNSKGTQIPGKIYQYSGTNKPILFILDGEKKAIFNNFLDVNDRYIFCDNKKDSIKLVIENVELFKKEYSPVKKFEKKIVVSKLFE